VLKKEISQGERVVIGLLKIYYGSWRHFAVENLSLPVELAEEIFIKTYK